MREASGGTTAGKTWAGSEREEEYEFVSEREKEKERDNREREREKERERRAQVAPPLAYAQSAPAVTAPAQQQQQQQQQQQPPPAQLNRHIVVRISVISRRGARLMVHMNAGKQEGVCAARHDRERRLVACVPRAEPRERAVRDQARVARQDGRRHDERVHERDRAAEAPGGQ